MNIDLENPFEIFTEQRGDQWAAQAPISGITVYAQSEREALMKLIIAVDGLCNYLKHKMQRIKEESTL